MFGLPGLLALGTAGGFGASAGALLKRDFIDNGRLKGLFDKGWNYLSGQSDLDAATAAQLKLQEQAQSFNSSQAALDREWQEKMANTEIQRRVKDLEAAGLNPWLAVMNGGVGAASSGSGAQATSAVGSAGSRTPKWSQLVNAANQLVNTGKGAANNMASSALRVAAIAIMAAMA